MKTKLKIIGIVALLIATLAVFVFSCIAAASDAQGAIVFIFTLPFIFLLLSGALALGLLLPKELRRTKYAALGLTCATYLIIAAFLAGALFSPFRPYTAGVMNIVSTGFEHIVGMSPYAWAHKR